MHWYTWSFAIDLWVKQVIYVLIFVMNGLSLKERWYLEFEVGVSSFDIYILLMGPMFTKREVRQAYAMTYLWCWVDMWRVALSQKNHK